jgi:hypothetical protein
MPRGSSKKAQAQPVAEEQDAPRYRINLANSPDSRSMSLVVADRRCYACQQGDTPQEVMETGPEDVMQRIVDHCAATPDYLLPDTPLKEAVFRLLLAGGNEPMTAAELGSALSERWAMSAYPREVSSAVVERLVENSPYYGIARAEGAKAHR